MDFIDWRKGPQKVKTETQKQIESSARKKARMHYIEEQIHDAMERGLFDNLPGYGKPLKFEDDFYAGDKAMGYHLLKNNGYVPAEVQLIKDIRTDREKAEAKVAKVKWRSKTLRARRVAPFPSEKRAFNASVEKAAAEYETALRTINSKILTLNIQTPPVLHQDMLNVEKLVAEFRKACPLFENISQTRTHWFY